MSPMERSAVFTSVDELISSMRSSEVEGMDDRHQLSSDSDDDIKNKTQRKTPPSSKGIAVMIVFYSNV